MVNISRHPVKLPIIYGLAGGLAGYFLLHPASMFIHQYYHDHMLGWAFLSMSFSRAHLVMALYYASIGMLAGVLFGIHPHRISVLLDRIRVLSVTDYLTGIYNRRYFFENFSQEIERASRYQRRLSLLMLDIDLFKRYNDSHGHQQGDYLLKALAQLISGSIRRPDFLARYGGEEFVVVAPETDRESAAALAEKIRSEVEQHPFRMREGQPEGRITVSIGVAVYPEDGLTADEMVGKADAALYIAKDLGRNQVVSARKTKAI